MTDIRIATYFQPIVDLTTGEVAGWEALLRFVNPDGSISPPWPRVQEIESDEEAYASVMRQMLMQIREQVAPVFTDRPHLYVSINVPPSMIGNGILKSAADEADIMPYVSHIVVEVTERQALCAVGREALAAARAMGVRVAVDDFGTGESGLAQLLGLEFDVLKVDKSQIDPIGQDVTAERLVRGLVALAGALKVKTVAEGIETPDQALFCRAAGIDCGQGWHWSKAAPFDQVRGMLDARR